jgi:Ca2+-binding EF-hand superfamily protein
MEILDESNSGEIKKNDLEKALKEVVAQNESELDVKALVNLIYDGDKPSLSR